jgi:hypothetical protein
MSEIALRKVVMDYILARFGSIDTERFISSIIKEPGDYTKWRQDKFEFEDDETMFSEIKEFEKQEMSV